MRLRLGNAADWFHEKITVGLKSMVTAWLPLEGRGVNAAGDLRRGIRGFSRRQCGLISLVRGAGTIWPARFEAGMTVTFSGMRMPARGRAHFGSWIYVSAGGDGGM